MELKQALQELRKEEKRKFEQTVDLIINFKGIDLKKNAISVIVNLPHKFKDKRICGFLENKSDLVKTITKPEFAKYSDKKELKKLVKDYDFFIANASLMPAVATTFGKVLGPAGKMPTPQLGVIMGDRPSAVKELVDKISTSLKIRAKEASVKLSVGKENMSDEKIIENVTEIYNAVLNALPQKVENIRNAMIKMTMTKPIVVEIK